MAMTKAQTIEAAIKLADEMEILEALTPELKELVDSMDIETMSKDNLSAILATLKEDHQAALQEDPVNEHEARYEPVWRCGQGSREIILAAPTKADALNELLEIEPVFKAIGAIAEPLMTRDGYQVFALIK